MATTPADVAVALGRSIPGQNDPTYQQYARWIANARLILRVGDGDHAGFGDLDLLDQEVVDYVVLEAVTDHARRPDNATTVEISVDDGRTSKTYQLGAGRVTIGDPWWAMLQPNRRAGGAFSIRPAYVPGAQTCP